MDLAGEIDIEPTKTSRLLCSTKDLYKLTKPEGCQLNVVKDKVLKMCEDDDEDEDDDGASDSEVDDVFDPEQKENALARNDRLNRMRREFISLVLNVNRDPIKPATKFKFSEYQDNSEDAQSIGQSYVGIHRQYENMGNYDEYMAKHQFEEISPGRVYKLKRVNGVQLPVSEDSLVMYNCAFWSENSKEPFDSTWLRRSTIATLLSNDSILPGLHELLLTCKQGELCEAFLRPQAAFGQLGVKPRIPPNATIFCLLEIVRVVTRDKYATITMKQGTNKSGIDFDDVYRAGDEARRRGNYYYEQKQYRIALTRYKSGIRILESLTYKNEDEESKAGDLLIKLYNNCARTANMLGNPRLALAACKQARLINDKVPKTHWHRMMAWRRKGHMDRALGVARRAMELFQQDSSVTRQFQRAAEELKIKIQREQHDLNHLHKLMGRAYLSNT